MSADLFSFAAEHAAMESGRPVSQEHALIVAPAPSTDALPLLAPGGVCNVHGTPLLLEAGSPRRFSCPRCAP